MHIEIDLAGDWTDAQSRRWRMLEVSYGTRRLLASIFQTRVTLSFELQANRLPDPLNASERPSLVGPKNVFSNCPLSAFQSRTERSSDAEAITGMVG